MKPALFFFAFCILHFASATAQPRPKLVVGIVVDQMRWDYLYRYYNHYGDDGLKRLMRNGFRCEQTFINYLPAFTAPGHSCIYTGSVPAINGIAGNDWYENGAHVYCTGDKSMQPVGGSWKWGQMSPKNLLTTTITDELRLATNMRSRVFAISLKDRSAILPGGHLANGVYWFDDSTGNFMTSNYYDDVLKVENPITGERWYQLPEWIGKFNKKRFSDSLLDADWTLQDSMSMYRSVLNDPYYSLGKEEGFTGPFPNEPTKGFPHHAKYFSGKGANKYNMLRKLPAGNTITLKLARACIKGNELGTKADPDFLAISFSATDYAGHQFGPNALEMEDMYIRLDDELARFLRFLDNNVGKGNYTVFLTADHGAAHNSILLNDLNVPAGNVYESTLRKGLNDYLQKELKVDSAVISCENYQVYFNPRPGGTTFPSGGIKDYAIRWLKARPEVAYVMDMEEPRTDGYFPEPIRTMAVNGYYAPRSGMLQIILKPGYYMGYAPTGTTHGTWNPYDTHIPLLWYGWGIPKGKTNREVHMTDIAATLAALLHIQMPNGCVGKVITEIVP